MLLKSTEYTKNMRSLSRHSVQEYQWTAEELDDPHIQGIVLSGMRRWRCLDCKKETLATLRPAGCVHYYKYSSKARLHLD